MADCARQSSNTADLPGLRIHDLRHSAASFMVNSGVDIFAVGKVLGHAGVILSANRGSSPDRYRWQRGSDGVDYLHSVKPAA